MKNFASLEGLRGYMAWCVVFSHALSFTGLANVIPRIGMIIDGSKAVHEFIIISGFVYF